MSVVVDNDFRALLSLTERPTALFAANDVSATAAMDVVREMGLRVPADLSIVGFDNIPESVLTEPPLTTVSQPIRRMGVVAIEMLIRLISGESLAVTHVTLPTDLVVRGTTRALPETAEDTP